MTRWWRDRSPREQRLLAAMAALFAVVTLWLAVLRPIAAAEARAAERHAAAVEALGRVRALGATARAAPTGTPGPLAVVIGRSADAAGLSLARIESQGDGRVVLAVEAVRPTAFFGWLGQLERAEALVVERVSATRNDDATIAVQAELRRGGR